MFINNFDPVAIEIFSLEIRWYSLSYIAGILIGWLLAKNLFFTSEQTIKRKVMEAIAALLIEFHYSKEEILLAYINDVFLAQSGKRAIHGFGMGAQHFFGTSVTNLETDQIFVIHDELDLAPGTVRAKLGGGDAGHNGLRSITSHIGANYWRIRLGIGHPGEKTRVTGHVLHDFTKADKVWVARTVEAVAKTIPLLLSGDATAFSTQITLLTQPHTTN